MIFLQRHYPGSLLVQKMGYTAFKWDEIKKFIINIHSDLYRSYEPIIYVRGGLELIKPIDKYGNIIFGFGYRKLPFLLDKEYAVDIKSLREYNKKYSFGIVFDLKLNKILNNNMLPFSSAIFGYTNETNYGMGMLDLHHITIELVSYNK